MLLLNRNMCVQKQQHKTKTEAAQICPMFKRDQAHHKYKTGWKRPSSHRAIYSGDDTWASNIKKPLKEACGDNVGRQVVDFM